MYYQEYARAAYRHLTTCNRLLNDVQSNVGTPSERNHWLCEAYYLSGYILECLLSYVLFYEYKDHVINNQYYCGVFLTHNLPSKVYHVRYIAGKSLNGVQLISVSHVKRSINYLFSNWSVNYRYEPIQRIDIDDMMIYLNSIEQAKDQILNMYPLL